MIGDRSNTMADYYSREYERRAMRPRWLWQVGTRKERKRLEKTADANGKNKIGALAGKK